MLCQGGHIILYQYTVQNTMPSLQPKHDSTFVSSQLAGCHLYDWQTCWSACADRIHSFMIGTFFNLAVWIDFVLVLCASGRQTNDFGRGI